MYVGSLNFRNKKRMEKDNVPEGGKNRVRVGMRRVRVEKNRVRVETNRLAEGGKNRVWQGGKNREGGKTG